MHSRWMQICPDPPWRGLKRMYSPVWEPHTKCQRPCGSVLLKIPGKKSYNWGYHLVTFIVVHFPVPWSIWFCWWIKWEIWWDHCLVSFKSLEVTLVSSIPSKMQYCFSFTLLVQCVCMCVSLCMCECVIYLSMCVGMYVCMYVCMCQEKNFI